MFLKVVIGFPLLLRPVRLSVAFLFVLSWGWGLDLAILSAEDETLPTRIDNDYELSDMVSPVLGDAHDEDMQFEKVSIESFGTVEWQVRLRASHNRSFDDQSKLDSLVSEFQIPTTGNLLLHWSEGSHARITDFQPMTTSLLEGKVFAIGSFGGRSSDGVLPFFNLESAGGGIVVAIGWSGDWRFEIERAKNDKIRLRAGLAKKSFQLREGDEVRLPSILMMGYKGSWIDGQNKLRRLLAQRYSPAGRAFEQLMPIAGSVHGVIGFNDTNETNLLEMIELIRSNKALDTFWLDAGWNKGGFPAGQGNPEHSPERFPAGLNSVGKQAKDKGLRFLVWFEPERVMRGSELHQQHPEWLLRPIGTPPELHYQEKDGFYLFDFGNPDARKWMVEKISKQIRESSIDIYRQDCNLYPAYYWDNALIPGTDVSNEVQYITGLYDFLEELQSRHPKVLFDHCASGGRRVDFEMLRRSVLLWRSDCTWGDPSAPRNMQAMTHGLSHWLPFHGLGATAIDDISLRSGMGGCASFAINYRSESDRKKLQQHLSRYAAIRDIYAADFYPLTPWTVDPKQWLAFQFHDPEKVRGIVQVFRGKSDNGDSVMFRLNALEKDKVYNVQDWDEAVSRRMTGGELMNGGLKVTEATREDIAKVWVYSKVD